MNDQLTKEGFWSDPLSTWLEQATWLEWLQPLLYFVLALVLASLLFTLLDLALMCWKEFHQATPSHDHTRPAVPAPQSRLAHAQAMALRFFFRP